MMILKSSHSDWCCNLKRCFGILGPFSFNYCVSVHIVLMVQHTGHVDTLTCYSFNFCQPAFAYRLWWNKQIMDEICLYWVWSLLWGRGLGKIEFAILFPKSLNIVVKLAIWNSVCLGTLDSCCDTNIVSFFFANIKVYCPCLVFLFWEIMR